MPEDFRPVPDPTVLTTQQLLRELQGLRELLLAEDKRLAEAIVSLERVQNEKFAAQANQMVAADRAIAKAEASATKEIDALKVLFNTATKALGDRIEDLKGRINRGEGSLEGGAMSRTEGSRMVSVGLVALSTIVALGALAVTIIVALSK